MTSESWLPLPDVIGGLAGIDDQPYPEAYQAMVRSTLGPDATTDPALREQVLRRSIALSRGEEGDPLAPAIDPWVTRVTLHAHETTDEDVAALKRHGYSEDAIYELTVVAALGAVLVRLEAAAAALQGNNA